MLLRSSTRMARFVAHSFFGFGPSPVRKHAAPAHRSQAWSAIAVRASILLGLVSSSGGCNSFRGLAQCRSVTTSINDVLEDVRELHAEEPTAERYKNIGKLLQGLETTLTGLVVADSELKQAVDEYVKQLHRSRRDSDAYANMLEQLDKAKSSNDAAATTSAQAELEKIRQRATRALETAKPLAKRFREACRK